MRWVVICLLAGCYTKPEQVLAPFDGPDDSPDGSSDALQPVDCSDVPFPASAMTMSEFGGGTNPSDPSLSANGLQMFISFDPNPTPTPYINDIALWRRGTANGIFALDPTVLAFNSPQADVDPSLTADGAMIFFISRRTNNTDRGYFATYASNTWSDAAPIPGLETMGMISLDISADGLALYFTDTSDPARLLVATRTSRTASFGVPDNVGINLGTGLRFPTVSADQLELFIDTSTGLKHASRAETASVFDFASPAFLASGVDPDLSADSETLVLAVGSTLGTLHRDCPAP